MAVLRAEVNYDDAFTDRLPVVTVFRSNTLQPLGNLEVRRYLQVIAGGDPTSLGQRAFSRGSTSWIALSDYFGPVTRGKCQGHWCRKTRAT